MHKNCRMPSRVLRHSLVACTFSFSCALALGQTSSSASSQTGTTAAPGTAPIQSRSTAAQITPQLITKYNERYDIFGGLSFMNGQAGQNLPQRYNMGGGEVTGIYWLGSRPVARLGVVADYRLEAGTTPVLPTPQFGRNHVLVYQNIISGGVEYRGLKNRYAAVDYHALVGASHGTFSSAITGYPANSTPLPTASEAGLYQNSTTPWGAVGGSIDFNQSPHLAIRLSPDLIFEHFGTETREFFSVGGGVMYRFGKRQR